MQTLLPIEQHPFAPFLPPTAKVLFLGSFPPQPKRWSMPFYYPNYTNDFWYMIGLIWFDDRRHFTFPSEKRFDQERIMSFCREQGIALYDTATAIRRLRDNASDKFLEVVTPTDLGMLLGQIPQCRTIVTTGEKATEIIAASYGTPQPKIGESVTLHIPHLGEYRHYRMPSTSRAYPLALEKKATAYGSLFRELGML